MDRLDRHGDNWRNASLPVELDEPIDPPLPTPPHEKTVVIPKPKVSENYFYSFGEFFFV